MKLSESTQKVCDWLNYSLGWSETKFITALSGGNSNLTWHLQSKSGSCVIRTPPSEDISPTSARGIEQEAHVLQALKGKGVRAPEVLAWCEDLDIIGRPFLVEEWVDGVALTDSLPTEYDQSSDAVNALGLDLIDQLVAVHKVPVKEPALQKLGRPERFLNRQIERWISLRSKHSVRELPELFRLGDWLGDNIPDAAAPTLIHGDYHLDNTLADKCSPKILAIIDWELATIGDPYMDLALMLMFWGDYRTQQPPAFARLQAISRRPGILSRRELAYRWSAALDRPLNHMNFYMALAFWRLAAIIEGAYALYVSGKLQSDYARGLEYDVPALIAEAESAASGDW